MSNSAEKVLVDYSKDIQLAIKEVKTRSNNSGLVPLLTKIATLYQQLGLAVKLFPPESSNILLNSYVPLDFNTIDETKLEIINRVTTTIITHAKLESAYNTNKYQLATKYRSK
jgi:hypothetical protein